MMVLLFSLLIVYMPLLCVAMLATHYVVKCDRIEYLDVRQQVLRTKARLQLRYETS